MMKKIQFKIVLMASAIIISGIAIFSIQEIPQVDAASDPFIGEIMWAGYNFAPRDWAFCDGQLLPISQNTALFSLIGTFYGGDGRTTFALPNLQGKAIMHQGAGPGLTPRQIGQSGGAETVTLGQNHMPSHTHVMTVNVNNDELGNEADPAGNYLAKQWRRAFHDNTGTTTSDTLAGAIIGNTGGSQAHNNMQPYLTLNCNIALQGIFPSRN